MEDNKNVTTADSFPHGGGLLGCLDITLINILTRWWHQMQGEKVIKITLRDIYMWAPNFTVIYPRWRDAAREVSKVISIPSLQYIPCWYMSLMGTTLGFAFWNGQASTPDPPTQKWCSNSRNIRPVLAELFFISPLKVHASLFSLGELRHSDRLWIRPDTDGVSQGVTLRCVLTVNDTVPRLIPNY